MKLRINSTLLYATLGLLLIRVVALYNAGASMNTLGKVGSDATVVLQQLKWMVAGIVFMTIATQLPKDIWKKIARPGFYFCLALLVAVLAFGTVINGAQRWIFGFQPSELAKIFLILILALRLSEFKNSLHHFGTAVKAVLLPMLPLLYLIFKQPNVSMMMLYLIICLGLIFLAGVPLRFILGTFIAAVPIVGYFTFASYRADRILNFINGGGSGTGYQQSNAIIGIGNGGLVGSDLGISRLGYVPEATTDTIFASIGEEFGFIGLSILIAIFTILIIQGFKIANQQDDLFYSLVAAGITISLAATFLIHTLVCVGLFPTTGQPLPLISHGGTNLVITLSAIGVLLGISKKKQITAQEIRARIV
ncbi:FtsW/RodA/SpoVE family cell cycle protein [Fibrobacterales bacterium]|nr:FtsW/RodA/SpoVE family cell cycle protein [Fibrobacterales bacterium]